MSAHTKSGNVYFITGGGTGGHIYPAVAIADALLKESDTEELYYVGNPENLEKKIADGKGFKFLNVDITGMPRKCGFCLVKWCAHLAFSTVKSLGYILKHRPDVVFGTGGYVSAPMLFASVLTRTPIVIHDCDAVPGIVSKMIAPYAKSVSVAFEAAKSVLNSKEVHVNGNPVREDFMTVNRAQAREKMGLKDLLTILVMGGSQGAKKLNSKLAGCLKELFENHQIQVIHQTGAANYDLTVEELKKVYPEYAENEDYVLAPYFDEMYLPLRACDIAVSRSGSLSISELCTSGAASILVPYPYAAADHQRKNAKEMERLCAALYLDDNDCTADYLKETLESLIDNPQSMRDLQEKAKILAKPQAAKNIVTQIKSALK